MDTLKGLSSLISGVNSQSFESVTLEVFRYQALNNPIYNRYIRALGLDHREIGRLSQIPFLPISFFKGHIIKTGSWNHTFVFTSSGTTNNTTSMHYVRDVNYYLRHSEQCFNHFFGNLTDYNFLGFLPSYLERSNSSLIVMMDYFIRESKSPYSGFYLHNVERLVADLENLKKDSRKTILWGVTFALLDLLGKYNLDLAGYIIIETGGMKGRGREMTRLELHKTLAAGFNVDKVYSEYGMTELLSQAYSSGDLFECPPWMKVLAREISDPFNVGVVGETGAINVIDLANLDSIAFIETEDLGKVYADGKFEVLGRLDNSDVRGCNLLV